jgi:hypothetical protein
MRCRPSTACAAAASGLTLCWPTHKSNEPSPDADARTNWLSAPDGKFALIVRAYVPTQPSDGNIISRAATAFDMPPLRRTLRL